MSDHAQPRLPKYRHFKPKDLGVVRLNGRDFYLGKYNTPESLERYRRVVAEWLLTGETPQAKEAKELAAPASDAVTVTQVVLAFWKHAEVHYRRADGTHTEELASYKRTLKVVRELYGDTPAGEFGPKRLKVVRQAMIDAGLSRGTINQRIGRVVRAFKWATEEEMIPPAVFQALQAVTGLQRNRTKARETAPVKPVSDAIVDAILPLVSRQVAAMVELQRLTGMRPGEVTIMRTGDLDVSGRVWMFVPGQHKMEHHGKERTIYLGPQAQEILRPWLKTDLAAYIFSPGEARQERFQRMRAARKTRVQPSQRNRSKPGPRRPGIRYTTRSYYYAIRRACDLAFPHPTLSAVPAENRSAAEKAELATWRREHRWHPNQLRHSAATRLRKQYGLDVARVILGHTSPAVTEVYAEVDREKALKVMGEVG